MYIIHTVYRNIKMSRVFVQKKCIHVFTKLFGLLAVIVFLLSVKRVEMWVVVGEEVVYKTSNVYTLNYV